MIRGSVPNERVCVCKCASKARPLIPMQNVRHVQVSASAGVWVRRPSDKAANLSLASPAHLRAQRRPLNQLQGLQPKYSNPATPAYRCR